MSFYFHFFNPLLSFGASPYARPHLLYTSPHFICLSVSDSASAHERVMKRSDPSLMVLTLFSDHDRLSESLPQLEAPHCRTRRSLLKDRSPKIHQRHQMSALLSWFPFLHSHSFGTLILLPTATHPLLMIQFPTCRRSRLRVWSTRP